MRYEWEAHDGYDASLDHSAGNITLTSLRDGMLSHKGLTEAGMAQQLNKSKMRPVLISLDDIKATN